MADDPDTLVDLTRTANELQAVSLIAELEAHEIPARHFGLGIMQYQMPALQPQRVMVRRADLERAIAVTEEWRSTPHEDVEWDEIDTGDVAPISSDEDPPEFICARCGTSRKGLPPRNRCPECDAPASQAQQFGGPAAPPVGLARGMILAIALVLIVLIVLGYIL
jgi:hypothetical protein